MSEEKSFVKNAADEEQVKEAGRKIKFKTDSDISDTKVVMSTPQGRRFVNRLIQLSSVNEDVAGPDTHMTYYSLGIQKVGKTLVRELNENCPAEHDLMVQEARKAVKNG